ncbi:MAG: cell division protein SepF [Lachnospiraceae bacterium]|nr:cell division protein SepF [Lachnospiraceae bacterium]
MAFIDKFAQALGFTSIANDPEEDEDYFEDDYEEDYEEPRNSRFNRSSRERDRNSDYRNSGYRKNETDYYNDRPSFGTNTRGYDRDPVTGEVRYSSGTGASDGYSSAERPNGRSYGSSYGTGPSFGSSSQSGPTYRTNSYSTSTTTGPNGKKILNLNASINMEVVVASPESFEEARVIAQSIKESKPVIINLEFIDHDIAQRMTDFLCGCCCAVNGNIQRIADKIFMIAPGNVDFAGDVDIRQSLQTEGLAFPFGSRDPYQ